MDDRDREKYKNLRAFIVLLAAFITWLFCMKYSNNLNRSLITLLVVIIVFYVIASVAIKLIDKIKNMEPAKPVNLTEEELIVEPTVEQPKEENQGGAAE